MEEKQYDFKPKTWVSFTILLILIAAMCCTIFITGQQLHITMLTCMGAAILLLVATGCSYKQIEDAILSSGNLTVPTLLILYIFTVTGFFEPHINLQHFVNYR